MSYVHPQLLSDNDSVTHCLHVYNTATSITEQISKVRAIETVYVKNVLLDRLGFHISGKENETIS